MGGARNDRPDRTFSGVADPSTVPSLTGPESSGPSPSGGLAEGRERVLGNGMKPDHLVPPVCSACGAIPTLIAKRSRVRRGARSLDVDGWLWECARCDDPFTGERPYRFSDPALLRWDDDQAAYDHP